MSFETVVCGVDGSEEGFVALAQARRFLAPGGRLVAVTACEDRLAVRAGAGAPRIAAQLRSEAAATRAQAERHLLGLPRCSAVVRYGRPADVLQRVVEQERADLLVVGSHRTGRAWGMLLGSVATTMLHESTCSILVARRGEEGEPFPRRIAVGVDGSPHAAAAEALAAALAEQFGATLRVVAALGGKTIEAGRLAGHVTRDERGPVPALEDASREADLVVVGSRGVHGFAALGSVSERVAHRARCSVLVLRPTEASRAADASLAGLYAVVTT